MNLRELDYKKIAIMVGFILICLVLIYFIYRIFFATSEPDINDTLPDFAGVGALPDVDVSRTGTLRDTEVEQEDARRIDDVDDVARGGFTSVVTVSDARVLDPAPTRDGRGIAYYDPRDGKFYRLSADGKQKTLMTDERFYAVESVTWAPNNESAVIEYPDGSNIIYDFTKRKSTTLPKEVVDPAFSEDSDQLVFKIDSSNPDDNWIVVTDNRTGSTQLVEPVGENGEDVQTMFSPDDRVVAVYSTPVGINKEEVYFIGKQGENLKSMFVNGLNFKGMYTPDGTRMLYHVISTVNGFVPELWVADVQGANTGRNMFDLGLNTWIDKCTISKNAYIVYCAVPDALPDGAGLSPRALETVSDLFYRIDLNTGLKRLIAIPSNEEGNMDIAVTKIWLGEGERYLFFQDAYTDKVFRIKLK